MSDKKYLIIIGGPTASGKTSLAIQLANYFHTEIISCDSRQFYKEMSIGTAKPTTIELEAAKHHFIGHISIQENYTVGDFEQEGLKKLEQLYQNKDIVIAVGGSGLYIKALCQGLDSFPKVPNEIRTAIEQKYKSEGLNWLQTSLKEADPAYYAEVDLNNPHRLIRALSVCEVANRPYSYYRRRQKHQRNFTPIYIQPYWNREILYSRINQRVDLMVKEGLLEEVESLANHKHLKALQTVGYQELFKYFEDESTLEEALEQIKRNSRRYAKRQLTWNRGEGHWKHFQPEDWKSSVEYIQWIIKNNAALKEIELEKHSQSKLCRLSMSLNKNQVVAALNINYFKQEILLQDIDWSEEAFINQHLWQEAFYRAGDRDIYYQGELSKLSAITQKSENWKAVSKLPKAIKSVLGNQDKLKAPLWMLSRI